MHAPKPGSESHTTYIYELLALLGIESERVIFIQTEVSLAGLVCCVSEEAPRGEHATA